MRPIDADALYEKLIYGTTRTIAGGGEYIAVWRVSDVIEDAPTIEQPKWISCEERLPDEGKYVEIWCGTHQIARIEKGITEEQRAAMKRGEMEDPEEIGWTLIGGYTKYKRSLSYKRCDELGNNTVPYCWIANGGPMCWHGQDVTHWRECVPPPKGDE